MKLPKNIVLDTTLSDTENCIGTKFSKLSCISIAGYVHESNSKVKCYLFKCDCGNTVIKRLKDVKTGKISSCGCVHKEHARQLGKSNKKENPTDKSAFTRYYKQYQSQAKRRNIYFDLDEKIFRILTSTKCHYCNAKPSKKYGDNWKGYSLPYICNGLDRKNNDEGYVINNVVPCCKQCNICKNTLNYDEFLLLIKRVYKNTWIANAPGTSELGGSKS